MRINNKYKSIKTTVNGIVFDSRKEARRYHELLLLQRAGVIRDLKMQVKYVLIPAQYETYERYGKKGRGLKTERGLLKKNVLILQTSFMRRTEKRLWRTQRELKQRIISSRES